MAKVEQDEIFTITAAQRGLSKEQVGRTRKYLISMGIRTACVIAAIFVPGWPRWVLIIGAVALPYLAVVVANAGRENDEPGEAAEISEPYRPALPSPGLELGGSTEVITVEPVDVYPQTDANVAPHEDIVVLQPEDIVILRPEDIVVHEQPVRRET